ncbi:MAG: glycosyltransferase family 2 protein [Paracoccaceae bacterium]
MTTNTQICEIDLSIIIPVWNRKNEIERLFEKLKAWRDVSFEVIFVDDFSTDGSRELIESWSETHPWVNAILFPKNMGAGCARNAGFKVAIGEYTLFFDDDDEMHTDVVGNAIDTARSENSDVVLMRYQIRNENSDVIAGMHKYDEVVWKNIRRLDRRYNRLTYKLWEIPWILPTTCYPWNKIVRTELYQKKGLRFSETRVNNDILGHWISLMEAHNVSFLDEVVCTHLEHAGNTQITKEFGVRRLEIFSVLKELDAFVCSTNESKRLYYQQYLFFSVRLIRWAQTRMQNNIAPLFGDLAANFYSDLEIVEILKLKREYPDQAKQLLKYASGAHFQDSRKRARKLMNSPD